MVAQIRVFNMMNSITTSKITDMKMRINDKGYYDIILGDNGDVETVEGFDTAIQMSIFCERRASESEVPRPQKRRGWWGNEASEIEGFEIGSKNWLLSQARLNQDTLNKSIDFNQQALEWFVEDVLLSRVNVTGEIKHGKIIDNIVLYEGNEVVKNIPLDLWARTFLDGEI